jgi:beta-fructofuranosidase
VLTPVAVVEITPDSPTIAAGTSLQLTATVLGPRGNRVTGRVVSWSSSDPGVATVSVGKVRGRTPGSARIEATAGDASGTTVVTVLLPWEPPTPVGAP